MKLDDFLKNPSFSKYTKEVQEFKNEFIAEECELFLWPPFEEVLMHGERLSG